MREIARPAKGDQEMMNVARKPDDDLVEIRISQLRELLEVLCAGDVRTAKEWLVAAIRKGKEELRNRSHKSNSWREKQ